MAPSWASGDAEDDEAEEDVDPLPDLELADADDHLGIDRLGQREVERAEADVLHEAVRLGRTTSWVDAATR